MNIKKTILNFFPCLSCAKVEHTLIDDINEFENFYKTRKIFSVLLDTRKSTAYDKMHIQHAVNVELSEIFHLKNFHYIKKRYAHIPINWVLFVYADDEFSTQKLEKALKTFFKELYFWECPNHVYYLKNGYTNT